MWKPTNGSEFWGIVCRPSFHIYEMRACYRSCLPPEEVCLELYLVARSLPEEPHFRVLLVLISWAAGDLVAAKEDLDLCC